MSYEQFLAALCLWREARGVSPAAMAGIWHVILNRARDSKNRWPKTVPGVILQRAQFSSFSIGDPNSVKFPIYEPHSADWQAWGQCVDVVSFSLGDDPTFGANHYESCEPGKLPAWADPSKITATIGPFRFYHL